MALTVSRTAPIAEIVAAHGATEAVFRRFEIDFCCRGDATVTEACRQLRLDPDEVLAEIDAAIGAARAPAPDARPAPEAALIAHIVVRHHAHERRALPYILSLLPKVAAWHRARNGKLDALCDAGQDLADTLEAYMEEEERRLFPALAAGGCDAVRGEMNRHARELAALLAQVKALSGGFVAPEWGDQSYRALMEELAALEEDVREHLWFEDHVLAARPVPARQ